MKPAPSGSTITEIYKSNITPDEISLWRGGGGDYVSFCQPPHQRTTKPPQSYSRINLLRTKNMRLTQPLVNVILLLLAIPAVLHAREPGRLKSAAAKCLVLCGLCMGAVFLSPPTCDLHADPGSGRLLAGR